MNIFLWDNWNYRAHINVQVSLHWCNIRSFYWHTYIVYQADCALSFSSSVTVTNRLTRWNQRECQTLHYTTMNEQINTYVCSFVHSYIQMISMVASRSKILVIHSLIPSFLHSINQSVVGRSFGQSLSLSVGQTQSRSITWTAMKFSLWTTKYHPGNTSIGVKTNKQTKNQPSYDEKQVNSLANK